MAVLKAAAILRPSGPRLHSAAKPERRRLIELLASTGCRPETPMCRPGKPWRSQGARLDFRLKSRRRSLPPLQPKYRREDSGRNSRSVPSFSDTRLLGFFGLIGEKERNKIVCRHG